MKRVLFFLFAAPLFLLTLFCGKSYSSEPVTLPQVHYPAARLATMNAAADVLTDAISFERGGIPQSLLKEARGIAVFPNISKSNLPAGPRSASGVLVTRSGEDLWSGPAFLSLSGPALETQIRRGSNDLVLVFMTTKSMDNLRMGTLDLGKDVQVASGLLPGRSRLEVDALAYGRSDTTFRGVLLNNSKVQFDKDANAKFYNRRNITANEILSGNTPRHVPSNTRMACVLAAISGTGTVHVC